MPNVICSGKLRQPLRELAIVFFPGWGGSFIQMSLLCDAAKVDQFACHLDQFFAIVLVAGSFL